MWTTTLLGAADTQSPKPSQCSRKELLSVSLRQQIHHYCKFSRCQTRRENDYCRSVTMPNPTHCQVCLRADRMILELKIPSVVPSLSWSCSAALKERTSCILAGGQAAAQGGSKVCFSLSGRLADAHMTLSAFLRLVLPHTGAE